MPRLFGVYRSSDGRVEYRPGSQLRHKAVPADASLLRIFMAQRRRQASEACRPQASLRRREGYQTKTAEALRSMVLPCSHAHLSRVYFCGRLLLAASSAAGPDACVDEEGSRSSWNWRQLTRYGLVDGLRALLLGRTRGRAESHSSRSAHSDFELLNAAIVEEATRQSAVKSAKREVDGKASEVTREECAASIVHEPTRPQARTPLAIRWPHAHFSLEPQ
jgi:hypothetical protein